MSNGFAFFAASFMAVLPSCALMRAAPVTPPPSAALAPCAVNAAPTDTLIVLTGAPTQAASDIIAAHQGGPLRLQVPADLPFEHVAALAAEASGPVALFDVELLGADGSLYTLPLELTGDLSATPWDGEMPAMTQPATPPSEALLGVLGSPEEASAADAPVSIHISGDRAWVDAGGQRQGVSVVDLPDAVGAANVGAEYPLGFLNATPDTPWEAVVIGLSALACGEEPGVVVLGRGD